MRRFTLTFLWALVFLFLLQNPAYANDPPAPQTMLAQLAIVPAALAFFVFSGAAAAYEVAGKGSTRRRRIFILLFASVLCVLSGMHEGFAILLSPMLAAYSIIYAIRMLRTAHLPQASRRTRMASTVGGVLLIPLLVFLASFSWAFFGYYDVSGSRGKYAIKWMQRFHAYQSKYAAAHGGKYHEIPLVSPDQQGTDESLNRTIYHDSGLGMLTVFFSRKELSLSYGGDLGSYTLKYGPVLFVPWPWYIFSPRQRAFYMDQTGIIRYEKLTGPGEATVNSQPLE